MSFQFSYISSCSVRSLHLNTSGAYEDLYSDSCRSSIRSLILIRTCSLLNQIRIINPITIRIIQMSIHVDLICDMIQFCIQIWYVLWVRWYVDSDWIQIGFIFQCVNQFRFVPPRRLFMEVSHKCIEIYWVLFWLFWYSNHIGVASGSSY